MGMIKIDHGGGKIVEIPITDNVYTNAVVLFAKRTGYDFDPDNKADVRSKQARGIALSEESWFWQQIGLWIGRKLRASGINPTRGNRLLTVSVEWGQPSPMTLSLDSGIYSAFVDLSGGELKAWARVKQYVGEQLLRFATAESNALERKIKASTEETLSRGLVR